MFSYRPLLKDGKEKVIRLYEERYALYNEYADKIVINDKNKKTVIEEIKKLIEEVKNDKMCNEI